MHRSRPHRSSTRALGVSTHTEAHPDSGSPLVGGWVGGLLVETTTAHLPPQISLNSPAQGSPARTTPRTHLQSRWPKPAPDPLPPRPSSTRHCAAALSLTTHSCLPRSPPNTRQTRRPLRAAKLLLVERATITSPAATRSLESVLRTLAPVYLGTQTTERPSTQASIHLGTQAPKHLGSLAPQVSRRGKKGEERRGQKEGRRRKKKKNEG